MSYTSKASTNTSKTVSSPLSSTVWIGNIGNDLSEQEVLDFAASVGKVIKFDFMYHDGKEAKLPRGYAFATYCDYSVANAALKNLNGKSLKGRRISVQPANSNYNSKSDFWKKVAASKESLKGLNLANSSNSSEVSKEDKIRAIEAKLKALEKGEDAFQVAVGKPKPHHLNRPSSLSNQHHSIKMKTSSKSSTGNSSSKLYHSKSKTNHHSKPYQKSSHYDKR